MVDEKGIDEHSEDKEYYKTNTPEKSLDLDDDTLLIHKVIGQPNAVQAVIDSAKSGRNLLLIGLPGTGKSMLGKALRQILPERQLFDVISKYNPKDPSTPKIKEIEAGTAQNVIQRENEMIQDLDKNYTYLTIFGIIVVILVGLTFLLLGQEIGLVETLFALLLIITWIMYRQRNSIKFLEKTSSVLITNEPGEVPFVDASGSSHHILLGDIRHDPYQSGGLETPAHHRITPGLVHKANGGILYIDEIGTLDPTSQFYLLTIMQEGKLPIEGRSEGSSGSLIKTEPVSCNFTLVAAGNYETVQLLHPALRSRIQGFGMEVLMEKRLEIVSIESVREIMRQLAYQELENDTIKLTDDGLDTLIYIGQILSQRDGYITLQFRELGGIIRAAYDLISFDGLNTITSHELLKAFERQLPVEDQMRHQELKSFINNVKQRWSRNKIWLRHPRDSDDETKYQVIEFISETWNNEQEDDMTSLTDNTKLLQSVRFKLRDTGLESESEYIDFTPHIPNLDLSEFPIAILIGLICPGQISKDTLILGTIGRQLNINPMKNISTEAYHALKTEFDEVIVFTSQDNRKTKIEEIEHRIRIFSDLQKFLRQIDDNSKN